MCRPFQREYTHTVNIFEFGASIKKNIDSDIALANGTVTEASVQLARYLSHLNLLHPFPEGNGRAQRGFIWLLARDFGYDLKWDKLNGDLIHAAARRLMVDADFGGNESLIQQIISPRPERFK